ncbi:MAG: phosphoserine phosphatase SerB [Acidobacteriota bacterium]
MDHVLTLATPAVSEVAAVALPKATAALAASGFQVGGAEWLAPDRALDLPFHGASRGAAEAGEGVVRRALADLPVDLAAQPREGRRKRLLVADMESTVIANEMLEELADHVGLRARVEEITARAMNGELDFRAALDERVALLRGLPISVLEDSLSSVRVDPGAAALVATMGAHGATTALVSGGFEFYAERIRDRLGFGLCRANRLGIRGGVLTGEVGEPILDRDAKRVILLELCGELSTDPSSAVTVGDGANDLPMLKAAGLGVAYHGKPAVAAAARYRIDHGDLSTLLFFQGYPAREWGTSPEASGPRG